MPVVRSKCVTQTTCLYERHACLLSKFLRARILLAGKLQKRMPEFDEWCMPSCLPLQGVVSPVQQILDSDGYLKIRRRWTRILVTFWKMAWQVEVCGDHNCKICMTDATFRIFENERSKTVVRHEVWLYHWARNTRIIPQFSISRASLTIFTKSRHDAFSKTWVPPGDVAALSTSVNWRISLNTPEQNPWPATSVTPSSSPWGLREPLWRSDEKLRREREQRL